MARDTTGRACAGLRDQLEIKTRRGENEARFVYENLLVLPAGQYQLFAYVRDNRTGKMSRTVCPIELPATGPIRASSLVLAAAWREIDNQQSYRIKSGKVETIVKNPLLVGSRALVPRLGGQFKPGETLYIHGNVSVPEKSPGLEYRVIVAETSGSRLFEGGWQPLEASSENIAEINARLPLVQVPPGKYTVAAEVRAAAGEVARLVREFSIVP